MRKYLCWWFGHKYSFDLYNNTNGYVGTTVCTCKRCGKITMMRG